MAWAIKFTRSAQKDAKKLDHEARQRIRQFEERLSASDDPRQLGQPLRGKMAPLWRYRVGSYRLVCAIRDEALVVLVIRIGHRREVYR
ncbi:type II toxin-antitoxin system mRNA interferase toxin, RelE/StbE family [Halorhodospira abdelmalekii]|uniref:type II toxin-antitoxin system mRNA interferase toxin, RelE/StbE family n=1 Tax=Halorhodospira abdelmalekii TaxID=421629 RepID=UPI00190337A4|nr:type II toxin-antitoxin system mRNA interferase toxin, RelE/StbE family [Halorhodospira abdelmalekii]